MEQFRLTVSTDDGWRELDLNDTLSFQWENTLLAVDSLTKNRSTQFNLPMSRRNKDVFSGAEKTEGAGVALRTKYTSQVACGHVSITGTLSIIEISGDEYKCYFYYSEAAAAVEAIRDKTFYSLYPTPIVIRTDSLSRSVTVNLQPIRLNYYAWPVNSSLTAFLGLCGISFDISRLNSFQLSNITSLYIRNAVWPEATAGASILSATTTITPLSQVTILYNKYYVWYTSIGSPNLFGAIRSLTTLPFFTLGDIENCYTFVTSLSDYNITLYPSWASIGTFTYEYIELGVATRNWSSSTYTLDTYYRYSISSPSSWSDTPRTLSISYGDALYLCAYDSATATRHAFDGTADTGAAFLNLVVTSVTFGDEATEAPAETYGTESTWPLLYEGSSVVVAPLVAPDYNLWDCLQDLAKMQGAAIMATANTISIVDTDTVFRESEDIFYAERVLSLNSIKRSYQSFGQINTVVAANYDESEPQQLIRTVAIDNANLDAVGNEQQLTIAAANGSTNYYTFDDEPIYVTSSQTTPPAYSGTPTMISESTEIELVVYMTFQRFSTLQPSTIVRYNGQNWAIVSCKWSDDEATLDLQRIKLT